MNFLLFLDYYLINKEISDIYIYVLESSNQLGREFNRKYFCFILFYIHFDIKKIVSMYVTELDLISLSIYCNNKFLLHILLSLKMYIARKQILKKHQNSLYLRKL